MTTLGVRLNQLIDESGLQQKEIAERLDIKIPTFNGYVNDIREPNFETLKKMADFFKVTVDFLIGYSDDRSSGHIYMPNDRTGYVLEESRFNPLPHLDDNMASFVMEPANKPYIEIAMDVKRKIMDYYDLNTEMAPKAKEKRD